MSEMLELKGSCLCGANAYTASGEPTGFFHCHCTRCRKSSGTGHASNILATNASLTWDQDGENRGIFPVPGAKHFRTVFCTNCGSPLPRYNAEAQMVVVPAGSLDHEPGLSPMARIFQDSKASWSCDQRDIPEFEQYPKSS